MSVIHAPREPEIDARIVALYVAVAVALGVFFLRLWYLQVLRSEEFSRRAEAMRTTRIERLAPRGLIFDRNGELLAGVKPAIVLTATPAVVKENPWVLDKVATQLGVPRKKLADKVEAASWRPFLPATIYVGVPLEVASRIAESKSALPGIGVESQPIRFYPDTTSLSHVLGYVWTPNDKDVARLKAAGIAPAEYVGKEGAERVYERELMGKPGGEVLEVDKHRRPVRLLRRNNPIPGDRLVMSLDMRLQRVATSLLAGRRGAAVAIAPSTGEVLCLVSAPSFDSALFSGGISSSDWARLTHDPSKPLFNRAVSASYAPGSTFKVVTSMAAQRAGVFSDWARGYCSGFYRIGNRQVRCLGTHGSIPFRTALARSCNAFFSDWAVRTGPDNLREAAIAAGLGRPTGIDLPAESGGVVPTPEWLAAQRPPRSWYPGDTVNMGIGQGEISMTPLQMACLAALVANDGVAFRPHLLKSMAPAWRPGQPSAVSPEPFAQFDAPPAFWHALKSAMAQVIEGGTATGSARIPGLLWAGKTGSAEHRRRELTHSWFMGFAPMEAPKIAVAVVVEAAGHGSEVAAPIARQLVETYLGIAPSSRSASANRVAASDAATASSPRPSAR